MSESSANGSRPASPTEPVWPGYPARLEIVIAMKNAITISLTTQEFVFIQSRAFGRKA